jgi:hypothetical protein
MHYNPRSILDAHLAMETDLGSMHTVDSYGKKRENMMSYSKTRYKKRCKTFYNSTQTRLFNQWYMQQVKRGRLMFGFQYIHHHFYHGDGEQWIMWDEIYSLLKDGEHGAQIIYLWKL